MKFTIYEFIALILIILSILISIALPIARYKIATNDDMDIVEKMFWMDLLNDR